MTTENRPVQKDDESWIEYALRLNDWYKQRRLEQREKDNEKVKREYNIVCKK